MHGPEPLMTEDKIEPRITVRNINMKFSDMVKALQSGMMKWDEIPVEVEPILDIKGEEAKNWLKKP